MATTETVPTTIDHPVHFRDIVVYSHSAYLYWWPVWAVGFLMAMWTAFDNHQAAFVPPHSVVTENRMIAPAGQVLQPPVVHVAQSPIPGALFVITLLLVVVFSNATLRGPWALFFAALVAACILLVSWLNLWEPLVLWARLLRIHINLGGYLSVAIPLFVIWLLTVFFLDRRAYIICSASQLRVHDRLSDVEQVFDGSHVTFEKKPYNWFHRLVGGARVTWC